MIRPAQIALGLLWLSGCASFHTGPMPNEPKDAQFMKIEGARVRYTDSGGDGSPVVLVHGFASAIEAWETVTSSLTPNHRVIALDLKGFGWTDRPPGDYSPKAQAQIVLGLLDRLGVKSAAFVGHSYGASVVLQLALMAPDRVNRIALYSAWVYEDQIPSFFHWARIDGVGEILFSLFYEEQPEERLLLAYYDPDNVDEKLVEKVHEAMDRPGTTRAALEAARGQRFFEIEDHYKEIQAPVLLIWGANDRVARLTYGERLKRQLPHAQLVVYTECGHLPMIEAKEASNAALVKFLDAGDRE